MPDEVVENSTGIKMPVRSETPDLLAMTATIVASYVGKNPVAASELPSVIQTVCAALAARRAGQAEPQSQEPRQPAVPIKKSVHRDHIVCLECGVHQKTLKRHLMNAHNLTPEAYRARWSLPKDYPLVAPDYAAQRSDLAKQIGLGRRPSAEAAAEPKKGRSTRAA